MRNNLVSVSLLQFELDIEPRLKPPLRQNIGQEGGSGRGGGGVNDSRDVSFTQTTKGRRSLSAGAKMTGGASFSLLWRSSLPGLLCLLLIQERLFSTSEIFRFTKLIQYFLNSMDS